MLRPSRRSSTASGSQPALIVGGIALAVMFGLVLFIVSRFDPNPSPAKGPTIVVPTSGPRPIPLPVVDVTPTPARRPTTTMAVATTRPPAPATTATTVPPTTTRPPATTTTSTCAVRVAGTCVL